MTDGTDGTPKSTRKDRMFEASGGTRFVRTDRFGVRRDAGELLLIGPNAWAGVAIPIDDLVEFAALHQDVPRWTEFMKDDPAEELTVPEETG